MYQYSHTIGALSPKLTVVTVFVMFASVATVSFTTAVVTATFVAYHQRRLGHDDERHRELLDALDRIEQRLDALDAPR